MADRFFYAGDWNGDVILTGTEAHHLSRVLRKQSGDQVELFDGQGAAAQAIVESISKRDVSLDLITQPETKPRPVPLITLAVAPPKGDRFRWLVEKATEIGVHQIIPIQTERSVVDPGEKKLEKLHQTMISACKQSGRNHLMEIQHVQKIESLKESEAAKGEIFFGCTPTPQVESPLQGMTFNAAMVLGIIGPEGGLTDKELEMLRSWGAKPVCVAPHILRIETAAIALASVLIATRMSESV